MSNHEPRQIQCVLRDGSGNLVRGSLVYVLEDLYATDADLQTQINGLSAGSAIGIGNRYARVGTTDSSPGTYTNTGGTSGRGQITSADLVVDNVTLANGDLVLVLYGVGSDKSANGLYEVTSAGSGSNGTWNRVSNMDADTDVTIGTMFTIEEGDTLKRTVWVVYSYDGVLGGASGNDILFVQVPTAATVPHILRLPGNSPDAIPINPNVADDEFEGTSLDTGGTRFPSATSWAWQNQDSSTITYSYSGIVIAMNTGDPISELRGIEQVAPSTPWTFRAKTSLALGDISQDYRTGFFIHNGTATNNYTFGPAVVSGSYTIRVRESITAGFSWDWDVSQASPVYLEIENDGTNIIFRASLTGHNGSFYTLISETLASRITSVTRIGLGVYQDGGAGNLVGMCAEWFRRIA